MQNSNGTASWLVFFHIPKTAGTTFRSIIKKNYAPSEIARCYGLSATDQTVSEILDATSAAADAKASIQNGIPLVLGHFGWSAIADLAPGQHKTFAFLRDPIDRVVSDYLHKQRVPPLENSRLAGLTSFESWISQPGWRNVHCRFLSSIPLWADEHDEQQHYQSARANLARLDIIGITERFDDSIVNLRYRLGWRRTGYRRQNTNPDPTQANQLKRRYATELETLNQYDIQLYQEALELFERQTRDIAAFKARKFLLSGTRQLRRR